MKRWQEPVDPARLGAYLLIFVGLLVFWGGIALMVYLAGK